MKQWQYNLGVTCYTIAIHIISPFLQKARLMVEGRKRTLEEVRKKRIPSDRYVWIHLSSLGEFEQGRPLIEKLKEEHPEYKVCLTFFSSSGYEMCKEYPLADIVSYLPFDTSEELVPFIEIVNPEFVLLVKYDFWLNMLAFLRQKRIPVYLVSAIFRPSQIFFSTRGNLFRQALRGLAHIFVQDKESQSLLEGIGVTNVSVTGDTRVDRVRAIAMTDDTNPVFRLFRQNADKAKCKVLVVGSSWEADEAFYLPLLEKFSDLRVVIAPHEVREERISELYKICSNRYKTQLYTSVLKDLNRLEEETKVLILDTIGLLSTIYRYGDVAYVGGGFGKGIHNTLEPATYGLPILFGPRFQKFIEASTLIEKGGAFSFETKEELDAFFEQLIKSPAKRIYAGKMAKEYVEEQGGATHLTLSQILSNQEKHRN